VSLKEIRLQNNTICGSIPDDIGELKKLEVLCLNDNEITGSVPSGLGSCTKLKLLQLQVT
jgi:Leucine-rich repeat (LRR) protein